MTDQGSASSPARRTRRQLLAGGTGALAAVLTAEALARPAPAAAADGDPIIMGTTNTMTRQTSVTNESADVDALSVRALGNGTGIGGQSDNGAGVSGLCVGTTGIGVSGLGPTGVSGTGMGIGDGVTGTGGPNDGDGVHGIGGTAGSGVHGDGGSAGGTGVFGIGGGGTGNGVAGLGAGTGPGVSGLGGASSGTGVRGTGGQANGSGVEGFGSGSGTGVHGRAATAGGIGVLAENTFGGAALKTTGPAVFSRSGVLAVAAGKSSAVQTGVALTAASLVLATMQQDRAGVSVRSAVPNVAGSSFTVHLNKAVTASIKVAWFVVN